VAKEAIRRERKSNSILHIKEETATRWRLIEWNDSTVYNMNATDYNWRSLGTIDLPYVHDTCIERMIRHCDFWP
jgi:hypothetical protein